MGRRQNEEKKKKKKPAILLLIPCSYILPLVPFFFFSFLVHGHDTADSYKEIKSNFLKIFPNK